MRVTFGTGRVVGAALLLLGWIGGCTDSVRPSAGALAVGTWGGANAGVIVTDSVTHVHVGCTFGDFPSRAVADADGRFSIDGDYLLKAFPIAQGPRLPARFTGRVVGNLLAFSVSVNDTAAGKVTSLGPVTVRLGTNPDLGPCPICAVPVRPATRVVADYFGQAGRTDAR